MGYESTLFVVNKTKLKIGSQPYGEVLAKINLCKTGHKFTSIFSGHPTMCRVYGDKIKNEVKTIDGVEYTLPIDYYGEVFTECTVEEVLNTIVEINKEEEYRRFDMVIPLLQYFTNNKSDWTDGEIVVLHCGM